MCQTREEAYNEMWNNCLSSDEIYFNITVQFDKYSPLLNCRECGKFIADFAEYQCLECCLAEMERDQDAYEADMRETYEAKVLADYMADDMLERIQERMEGIMG